ncbi:transporter substrate-binding domain-containing protein [Endozoicomonas arenosclerae]|uniref:transporter substrate-binding domain-containing protein n=1 Tax=Endozoicomonas arenosclerae TaxID=1633495 RepID=UPI00155F8417|nr:transporter substrate-binding domain-containing protein [Endozoicomonas arenosclerae]
MDEILKKFFLLTVLPVLFSISTISLADDSRLHEILRTGELRVATTGDLDPLSLFNPTREYYRGFDIDLVKALASDLEVKLTLVPVHWRTMVEGVRQGRYDLTTSAVINMERAKWVGFSDSYLSVQTVPIILEKNKSKFPSWSSLNRQGVDIVVTQGGVFEHRARTFFPDANIDPVQRPDDDFMKVIWGQSDVYLTSNLEAMSLKSRFPNLVVVEKGRPKQVNMMAMMMPQDDQVWINYINHWLRLKDKQGLIDELKARWMPHYL